MKLYWNQDSGALQESRYGPLVSTLCAKRSQILSLDIGGVAKLPDAGELRFTVRLKPGGPLVLLAILTNAAWEAESETYTLSLPVTGGALDTLLGIGGSEIVQTNLLAEFASRPDSSVDANWSISRTIHFQVWDNITRLSDAPPSTPPTYVWLAIPLDSGPGGIATLSEGSYSYDAETGIITLTGGGGDTGGNVFGRDGSGNLTVTFDGVTKIVSLFDTDSPP